MVKDIHQDRDKDDKHVDSDRTLVIVEGLDGNYRDEEANSCCCTKLERKARHYIRPRANWYLIQEHEAGRCRTIRQITTTQYIFYWLAPTLTAIFAHVSCMKLPNGV